MLFIYLDLVGGACGVSMQDDESNDNEHMYEGLGISVTAMDWPLD